MFRWEGKSKKSEETKCRSYSYSSWGSKKHGGADLGPTRAKRAWAELGIDAMGAANDSDQCVPDRDLFRSTGPMLTVEQAAIFQGFLCYWELYGGKAALRQVGNAFPSPVAEAVGRAIAVVLDPECWRGKLKGLTMEDGARDKEPAGLFSEREVFVSSRTDVISASDNRGYDLVNAVG